MKTLELEKTVVVKETKYQAVDGKVFDSPEECRTYENELKVAKFKYDRSKATGKLTMSNWKHYVYRHYEEFGPISYHSKATALEESTYRKREGGKLQKFRLKDVKEALVRKFFTPENGFEYRHEYNTRRYSDIITEKDTERMLNAFDFFISSGLVTAEDIIPMYDMPDWQLRDGDKQIPVEDRIRYFSKALISECVLHDSTEAFDILYDNLDLDLAAVMSHAEQGNWASSSTKDLKRDFITNIVFSEYNDHGFNWDDEKRIKWLKHLVVDRDIPVKMFNFATMRAKISSDRRGIYSSAKGDEIYLIHPSIQEVIRDIDEFCRNNNRIFLFQNSADKAISIFNNAGPNFRKANENNKRPELYSFVQEVFGIVKEVFSEQPSYSMMYHDNQLFSIKRYGKSSDEKRIKTRGDHRKEDSYIEVDFYLDCLGRMYEKRFDVVTIKKHIPGGYKVDEINTTLMSSDLKDYKNPSDLATDIIYHLSEGKLITTNTNINQIELKLREIRDKKAELLKEEAKLLEEKSMVDKIIKNERQGNRDN